ncbi:VOC family protein [Saccharopolyspora phatthalungensis]|uniref:Catechol 2,3-dioxygenase-like lactoylglutathione lyase family enzyme n=1 Tax=Saccharopolyspora phatthalungensis TaxID=664693 RepID=A0A840QBI6_9PSEU|nr:VOC family protein [Saccharopolyspora phatthalungensis]MBB5157776.1 catechol 2,3-dioxygenase-like lactoylglutathione lyase family enzyme [Saccharopolyspora phatthalungensis]
MSVQLNHTIVATSDKVAGARFLADLLGLPAPEPFGPFMCVQTGNDVSLDYLETGDAIVPQHYAFLISEEEFDEIFGRIKAQELAYWAGPRHQEPGRINTRDGGRGVYFDDPDGHILEILTRPYGSGG